MPTGLRIRASPEMCAVLAITAYGGKGRAPKKYPYRTLPWPFNVRLPRMKGEGRRVY